MTDRRGLRAIKQRKQKQYWTATAKLNKLPGGLKRGFGKSARRGKPGRKFGHKRIPNKTKGGKVTKYKLGETNENA